MNAQNFINQFESFQIPIPGVRLPSFIVEQQYKQKYNITDDISNYDFLRMLCQKGFSMLNLEKDSEDYKKYVNRVKYELEMINELGFVDYFLLVWDIINFCRENNIATSIGRGSCNASLILFLIDVTKVDPIKYNLYFERFISKARSKKRIIDGITYLDGSLAPDVDLDICFYQRHKVEEYIENKFKGKTSKILTFNTLSGRLLMKEVGKLAGNKKEEEMTMVSNMIPKVFGVVKDIDKAYEEVPEFKKWCDENSLIYQIALKLKDLNKNKGIHPSGILISYDKLDESCPTELSSDKQSVSSYDMNWVSLSSLKVDILGLRCVSVVDDICKSLNIKIEDIDINHPSIYQSLFDLKYPHGLFQIEADLAYQCVKKVKPKNLNDLSVILALSRPGALQFIDKYANFSNTGTVDSLHPFLDNLLGETGNICVYQEQTLFMLNSIGFTKEESEIARRIIGKKDTLKVKEWEQKIYNKIKEKNLDPEIGKILWRIINDSANYQFNAGHSRAYSILTAITVYLKFNHPKEFYLSLLKMTKHEPDPITEISKIHREMHGFGIKLLPPNLRTSKMDFSIEGNDIRFGLSSIKGVSDKTIEKLDNFRREFSNKFEMFQSAREAGLSIGVLSAIIQAGVLDCFSKTRTHLVYEAQLWNKLSDKEKKYAMDYGPKYEYKLAKLVKEMNAILKNEKNKPLISDSRFLTIQKHTKLYKEIYAKNSVSEKYANWWYEKRLLGYVTYVTLLEIFRDSKPTLINISEALSQPEDRYVDFIGIVDEDPKSGTSQKTKSKYAKFSISDEFGTMKVMIFNDALEQCKIFNGTLPKEKDVVIVTGKRKGEDCVFANTIMSQRNKIFDSLLTIKDDIKEI